MRLECVPARYEAFRTERPDLTLCRVASREKGLYWLFGASGTQRARVSGKFQYDAKSASDYPTVGDCVLADFKNIDTIRLLSNRITILPTLFCIALAFAHSPVGMSDTQIWR